MICSFILWVAIWTSPKPGSGTNDTSVCISVCLALKFPLFKHCMKLHGNYHSHIYHVGFGFVALCNFFYAFIHISNIFVLGVCFNLINSVFQIFPPYFLFMKALLVSCLTVFTFYPLIWLGFCDCCNLVCFLWSVILAFFNTSHFIILFQVHLLLSMFSSKFSNTKEGNPISWTSWWQSRTSSLQGNHRYILLKVIIRPWLVTVFGHIPGITTITACVL